MALKHNVSAVWKDIVIWTNVAGTWKKCAMHHNVSAVWKAITTLISSLMPATLTDYDYAVQPGTATAFLTLNTSGTYTGGAGGTWRGGGVSADYDAYWTTTSGTLSGGTAGSWLNLGTARTWTRNRGSVGIQTTVGTLQIRMAASPFTVLSTSTITLTAEVESNL